MPDDGSIFPQEILQLALALGVGLLVGFERERRSDTFAGVRTFGLAALAGGVAALVGPSDGTPWPLLVVTAISAAAGIAGGIASSNGAARDGALRAAADDGVPNGSDAVRGAAPESERPREIGLTTAFALVVTTLLGGYAVLGDRATTVAGAGTLFLLLYVRDPLHAVIRRLSKEDVRAIAIFVLIALVVLPVLPDRDVGPLDAVNPRSAWLLVVLVVGLSLAGYVAQALLGPRAGVLATGLLGGLVSSTATTAGAARRAREGGSPRASAAAALLACGVLPIRLLVLLGVVSRPLATVIWPWLAGIALATFAAGLVSLRRAPHVGETAGSTALEPPRNPTQLSSALVFAGIFVLIRIVTKATILYAGTSALFVVAAVSGISDMDAIALSIARELEAGAGAVGDVVPEHAGITATTAVQATLVALAANTLFKLGIARMMGNARLFWMMLSGLGAALVVAIAGIVFA
jgi:uncharacterized membrane protein (DUF4010 family)